MTFDREDKLVNHGSLTTASVSLNMENYQEFTSLLNPERKVTKSQFIMTVAPFMLLQASVGLCASLQVGKKRIVSFLSCVWSIDLNPAFLLVN